ncbi:hypothetical protein SAMN02982929_02050 [Saccharopolyspora kobensis]|uniref:Uncharacterized protein n=1 Tax=Saccharopolyspora kobensis TaxID=146035 RepID=A0A1H5ZZY0_9PSEU|nr:hypothetical protein [Saccharopolyspora kobensis]SEG41247.1 hypothetical protein SAMN02982929_02050 [Saccharopolyspora kobensis]SFE16096.1 hypothetical protein SAMN05216506_109111 [Saccharopolyspora kobensis]
MRHHVPALIGTLATAGALALSLAVPAHAASGVLRIGFQSYENPSGCYGSDVIPVSVDNRTDAPAYVYSGQQCNGEVVGIVEPGRRGVFEFGASVYID